MQTQPRTARQTIAQASLAAAYTTRAKAIALGNRALVSKLDAEIAIYKRNAAKP